MQREIVAVGMAAIVLAAFESIEGRYGLTSDEENMFARVEALQLPSPDALLTETDMAAARQAMWAFECPTVSALLYNAAAPLVPESVKSDPLIQSSWWFVVRSEHYAEINACESGAELWAAERALRATGEADTPIQHHIDGIEARPRGHKFIEQRDWAASKLSIPLNGEERPASAIYSAGYFIDRWERLDTDAKKIAFDVPVYLLVWAKRAAQFEGNVGLLPDDYADLLQRAMALAGPDAGEKAVRHAEASDVDGWSPPASFHSAPDDYFAPLLEKRARAAGIPRDEVRAMPPLFLPLDDG